MVNAYLSSVISISMVLLLVGIASMILVNTDSISNYFKENMKISVIMLPEVSEEQALDYKTTVDSRPFIHTAEFVSRRQGEEEMKQMLGEDFLSVFETSPIPVSIDITLVADYVVEDSLEVVKNILSESSLVDEVVYQKSLVDDLNANLGKISAILGVFIILLLFISFVLISNTVRLNVYARRFTIHTMKLVGATRSFIRGPFLARAAILGVFFGADRHNDPCRPAVCDKSRAVKHVRTVRPAAAAPRHGHSPCVRSGDLRGQLLLCGEQTAVAG